MKRIFQTLLLGFGIILLIACSSERTISENPSKSEGAIQVVATIAQIGEPISVIGGDRVQVTSLMGPGTDPHLYQATQGDIRTLQGADIVFYNGLHLEGNMAEIFEKLKETKPTFAFGDAIEESLLLKDETGAIDPHIWFDIDLWKMALDQATEELKKFSPGDADYFEENKKAYFSRLDGLKREAGEKLSGIPKERRVLVTAHDAFGYFGRMFEIEVVGLQGLSTEDEVGLSDIQETVNLLIEKQIPAVFVESSINQNSIQAVIDGAAKAGWKVSLGGELFSDAMGKEGTEEGTFLGMYRHNVDTIYEALMGEDE